MTSSKTPTELDSEYVAIQGGDSSTEDNISEEDNTSFENEDIRDNKGDDISTSNTQDQPKSTSIEPHKPERLRKKTGEQSISSGLLAKALSVQAVPSSYKSAVSPENVDF